MKSFRDFFTEWIVPRNSRYCYIPCYVLSGLLLLFAMAAPIVNAVTNRGKKQMDIVLVMLPLQLGLWLLIAVGTYQWFASEIERGSCTLVILFYVAQIFFLIAMMTIVVAMAEVVPLESKEIIEYIFAPSLAVATFLAIVIFTCMTK